MQLRKIWIEQCEAAKGIEAEFGTDKALEYLIGEKFINFLDKAESDAAFREEIPAFVAEIKTIFKPWQLAGYLEIARQTEPFDPKDYDDEEEAEMERQLELRRSAAELLLVERAREWLLGDHSVKSRNNLQSCNPSFFRRLLTKRKVTILDLHFDTLTEADADDFNKICKKGCVEKESTAGTHRRRATADSGTS